MSSRNRRILIVIECPIGSSIMEKAGNIGPVDSENYNLRWLENTEAGTKGRLQGRHNYDFVIRFSQIPPEGSSLWISWLQKGSD